MEARSFLPGSPAQDMYSDEDSEESEGDAAGFWSEQHRFSFDEIFQQETEHINHLRDRRSYDGHGNERFSLAFSGGGIRAAAFQAGVLWRLAQEDRLKDVDYLTAVSGGGYIAAAFASHCAAEGIPEPGEVKEWYMSVVAKTLKRMQVNAGDFVRDCWQNPCYSEYSAGMLPRIFDLPILLAVLFVTLMVHPLVFVVCFVVPFTIVVDHFFGAAMRATFCAPPSQKWWTVFFQFSSLKYFMQGLVALVFASICVAIVRVLWPSCKLQREEGYKRRRARTCYLIGHATGALLKRLAWYTFIFIILVVAVPLEEGFQYSSEEVFDICWTYVHQQHHDPTFQPGCSDYQDNDLWYNSIEFTNYTKHNLGFFQFNEPTKSQTKGGTVGQRRLMVNGTAMLIIGVGCVLTLSICFMPIIGSQLFIAMVAVAGPFVLLGWTLTFVQYFVFGPITNNAKGIFGKYDSRWFEDGITCCLGFALVLLPFYEDIRAGLHLYYKRCLRQNFFAGGEDITIKELIKNPYCPFLILTGTSNDYQPPDDTDKISELSFSPLHVGGEETGYYENPSYRSLSKCAAISGAGCLDAISLSMNDALSLRFWLEVLNLTWGDYIILDHISWWTCARCFGTKFEGVMIRLSHHGPGAVLWFIIFLIINVAWQRISGHNKECAGATELLKIVSIALVAVFSLSFYSFFPVCDVIAMSPLVRQMQQVTRYFFVGEKPPRMLYMTDGGVKDCTSIVQLLWRRRKRILLVLAAADANDDLAVLKSAFEVAVKLKLANFYDPEDPRKDIDVLLNKFKEDQGMPYMHIGISYSWDAEPGSTGHLFIVKNRLPPDFNGPVRRPLTEEEVLGSEDRDFEGDESDDWDPDSWGALKTEDLGPFGCCDCCHTSGLNCGPKFPHGSFTGYLYLSPMWCSSLMRLGHDVSKPAIDQVCSSGSLSDAFERGLSK